MQINQTVLFGIEFVCRNDVIKTLSANRISAPSPSGKNAAINLLERCNARQMEQAVQQKIMKRDECPKNTAYRSSTKV